MDYFGQISNDKLSSLISLSVALVIVLASFFQWWNITWDGMVTRVWIKIILSICAILLFIAIILII